MKKSIKIVLLVVIASLSVTGCAQKVRIKALNPAEISEMASKKRIAVSNFKSDNVGLSGKIEAELAKHKLDKKKYFSVLSRKDMDKIISEQKLQSSDSMDEETATKVGKLIGAQAIIGGEIAVASAEDFTYEVDKERCLEYYKSGACSKYRYYKEQCKITRATVSANLNILNVETGIIIFGDTISKNYSADSCKVNNLFSKTQGVLSKAQALNKLASSIATEFVHKLTPNYVYFSVTLLDKIKLKTVTYDQKKTFDIALDYIEVTRYDKARKILEKLMKDVDGNSYVVAYTLGVIYEATGDLDKAKKLYNIADEISIEPVDEINLALSRIDSSIEKMAEAKKQIDAK